MSSNSELPQKKAGATKKVYIIRRPTTAASSSKSTTTTVNSSSSAHPAAASVLAPIRTCLKLFRKPINVNTPSTTSNPWFRRINTPTSSRSSVKQSIEHKVTEAPLQDVSPTTPLLQGRKPSVSSLKGKEKAGLAEESSQLANHPRVSGKTTPLRSTTPEQVPSPNDDDALKLGTKRSVDKLAAPNCKEQNFPDADLEEGETRSPSPAPNKKQKTAASSTTAIKPRPKSPRRRKSPNQRAQVPVREPSPREPSQEPIRRGTLSRREPYPRDSSIESTNRSKSPSRRESRRDNQSNQRRRSISPARRDSRRGTSPVRQSLPTRDVSPVIPVRRGEGAQNQASSSARRQKPRHSILR